MPPVATNRPAASISAGIARPLARQRRTASSMRSTSSHASTELVSRPPTCAALSMPLRPKPWASESLGLAIAMTLVASRAHGTGVDGRFGLYFLNALGASLAATCC